MRNPQISPKEWRWAVGWSIAIVLLSCLPYLITTVAATPPGWQFTGLLANPLDNNTYLAKIRQGYNGSWLFHLEYTPEAQQGSFTYTFYLALGHLAALVGLPPVLMFHLARLAAGWGLLLVAFRFIAAVTPDHKERRLAFILVMTASGLGWLGAMLDLFPIDLWVPEAFVPYSLFANPHFPLTMLLMLLIFQAVAWPGPGWRPLLWTGLAALAQAIVLPFTLLTTWAVLGLYLGWLYLVTARLPWRQIWLTLTAGLFPLPIILYHYWLSVANPLIEAWVAQDVNITPGPLNVGLGYGLVGLLALGGAWHIARRGRTDPRPGEGLVLSWAVATLVIIYIPFSLQRRLIIGLHIPLCILAALGLRRWLAAGLKPRYQRLLATGVVTMGLLGTLFVWSIPLLMAFQPPAESPSTALLFMRREEMAAFGWLREHTTPRQVVLASPRVGLFIPPQTGTHVFYGHPLETIRAEERRATAEAFYRGELEAPPAPVDFIFYGPSEQALGRPQHLSDYPVAFSAGQVTIYKVTE